MAITSVPTEKIQEEEQKTTVEIQPSTQADNKAVSSTSPKDIDNDESKSSSLATITDSINSNNIVQTNIISSEYTIIDNILYLFNKYNNTIIYDYIVEFMLQDFNGINNQKMFIKGLNDFLFEITTEANQKELAINKMRNQLNSSLIDLGECSNLLKRTYFQNNDNVSLIILKFE